MLKIVKNIYFMGVAEKYWGVLKMIEGMLGKYWGMRTPPPQDPPLGED